ncbi:unnamed protein product [Ilex paraguariensis]|uniref:Uncharacterized protein n=1 Tax=Ilex paraguariensis TaxID=185542 RepID=A0ABC8UCC7_9AQUA
MEHFDRKFSLGDRHPPSSVLPTSFTSHFCAIRFVLSLENDLTVRAKTTEVAVKDFSSGSYGTIFGEEIGRRIKQVPLAFYNATPTSLFSESDFPGWTFKSNCDEEEPITTNEDENRKKSMYEEHDHNFVKRQRMECS